MNRRIKIAYLTSTDARDKRSWSGIHYYIAKALKKNIGEVEYLGPVSLGFPKLLGRAISFIFQKLLNKRFDYEHSIFISKLYGRVFAKKLDGKDYDLIVAPASSSKIAFLKTDIPIIYISDTTFANMIDYYTSFSRLLDISKKQGHLIERLAIKKSKIVIFPSEWASNSAKNDYGADENKIFVIPFGANIDEFPTRELVMNKRKNKVCKLLFLGVDWERKGGEIAFNTLLKLNELGLESELTVCGCVPPKNYNHPKMNVIPFINKNDKAQYQTFQQILLNSDFLLLPTRAECYGIVFCEASAYGLPVITTNTGGVSGAVKDGVNGFLLSVDADANEYAIKIMELFSNDEKYYSLVKSSRNLFEKKLNWDAWALEVKKIIIEKGLISKQMI
jgi:glycosyltransferase involved in cell wall biosynthesis